MKFFIIFLLGLILSTQSQALIANMDSITELDSYLPEASGARAISAVTLPNGDFLVAGNVTISKFPFSVGQVRLGGLQKKWSTVLDTNSLGKAVIMTGVCSSKDGSKIYAVGASKSKTYYDIVIWISKDLGKSWSAIPGKEDMAATNCRVDSSGELQLLAMEHPEPKIWNALFISSNDEMANTEISKLNPAKSISEPIDFIETQSGVIFISGSIKYPTEENDRGVIYSRINGKWTLNDSFALEGYYGYLEAIKSDSSGLLYAAGRFGKNLSDTQTIGNLRTYASKDQGLTWSLSDEVKGTSTQVAAYGLGILGDTVRVVGRDGDRAIIRKRDSAESGWYTSYESLSSEKTKFVFLGTTPSTSGEGLIAWGYFLENNSPRWWVGVVK